MKKIMMIVFATGVLCTLVSGVFATTLLTGTLTADDGFKAYISTSDTSQGYQIGSGTTWASMYSLNSTLLTASKYYLHIEAWDNAGVIAGFLGDFNLSGTGYVFANGTQSLLTNTSDWNVSAKGFGENYTTPTVVTPHPSWFKPSSNQSWIWTDGGQALYQTRYFSTEITAVPEPGSILAACSILAPVGFVFRRKKK